MTDSIDVAYVSAFILTHGARESKIAVSPYAIRTQDARAQTELFVGTSDDEDTFFSFGSLTCVRFQTYFSVHRNNSSFQAIRTSVVVFSFSAKNTKFRGSNVENVTTAPHS